MEERDVFRPRGVVPIAARAGEQPIGDRHRDDSLRALGVALLAWLGFTLPSALILIVFEHLLGRDSVASYLDSTG